MYVRLKLALHLSCSLLCLNNVGCFVYFTLLYSVQLMPCEWSICELLWKFLCDELTYHPYMEAFVNSNIHCSCDEHILVSVSYLSFKHMLFL